MTNDNQPTTASATPEVARNVWVVTAPSAYRMAHTCFLGRGATKEAAMLDAFGPREAWGNATRRSIRNADIYETTVAEADELEFNSSN
jgi:hypothetical protein